MKPNPEDQWPPFETAFRELLELSVRCFYRYGVLENDILLNLTAVLSQKRYESDWQAVHIFSKAVIRHCILEQFDSATRQQLLLNCFYSLVSLSFDNYLGLVLPDLLFNKSESVHKEEDFSWDSNSFIYGFLLESWFHDLFAGESVDAGLMMDICSCLCSSLLLFVENLGRDSPFDRKSKAATFCVEKIAIEIRDVSFKIITLVFGKIKSQSPTLVAKSAGCMKVVSQILELPASNPLDKGRQIFKPNLLCLVNDGSVPLHLKKDLLLFYLRSYPEAADLKALDWDRLFAEAQK